MHHVAGVPHYPYIPLTIEPLVTVSDETILVLRDGDPELELWALDGTLRSVIRWRPDDRLRTADIWSRYKRESLDQISNADMRQRYAHYYEEDLPLPEWIPVADQQLVDPGGNVWVRRYRLPWSGKTEWDVFDPEGQWLGTVLIPSDVRVFEFGSDYLLGRHLDSLRVERIVLHEVRRN